MLLGKRQQEFFRAATTHILVNKGERENLSRGVPIKYGQMFLDCPIGVPYASPRWDVCICVYFTYMA